MEDDKTLDAAGAISTSLTDIVLSTITGVPAPIATIGLQGLNIYQKFKESHFTSKLLAFLKEPKKLNEKTKREFEKRLGKDREKFMNEVFHTIDHLENEEKAEILSKVFAVYMARKIKSTEFHALCNIISRTTYQDLLYFEASQRRLNVKSFNFKKDTVKRLSYFGLIDEEQKLDYGRAKQRAERLGGDGMPQVEFLYKTTDIGVLLMNIIKLSVDDFIKKKF